ncbi:glucose-6-phosphate dehydrogenase assembly protein OpcA [Jonesia quinghaiensis]|uniref:glucose-6-phosphate dehydrogenase assembly protein OpcA n=1 Tax=Jonesia quinghaiensis TaxID=262806 RepID=UPI00041AA5E6|nr:glucose-6-phosphate dehydrogenase assembly protein OpcA [Jonesia quinghaiensis]
MIIDLPDTTTSKVARKLVKIREEGGQIALGRVLNLVILGNVDELDDAIAAANIASNEHPCRIIAVAASSDGTSTLDAQIRVGGDAGASEVIVLTGNSDQVAHTDTLIMPLLLPDAPIVAWWPGQAPIAPAQEPLGAMAQTRLTDSLQSSNPCGDLDALRKNHQPGDVDLAWTRATVWRGLIASVLDQPPYVGIERIDIEGQRNHPSVNLLAGWLGLKLSAEVTTQFIDEALGLTRVALHRADGSTIEFTRADGKRALLRQPGMPEQGINLPIRSLEDCIAEELRRLHPDEVYTDVLLNGLPLITEKTPANTEV